MFHDLKKKKWAIGEFHAQFNQSSQFEPRISGFYFIRTIYSNIYCLSVGHL